MNPTTLLILFIVNFAADSYGQQSKKFFRSDYTYIEEVQSFYKFHDPQTWADAKRICAQELATFWYPENDNEAKVFLEFANKTKPNIDYMFVGMSDLLVEGVFETVEGKSISEVYQNWLAGDPDNFEGTQNCVNFYIKEGPGYIADDECDKKLSFNCKKTLQSLEWNEQCDMPYLDYTYSYKNGKCYKVHTTPLKWNEANAVCRLEQSSLAKVNNRQEAYYLAKLTESTPTPKVKGKYQRGIYHMGFYNRFNEGWQTIGGKPMVVDLNLWWGNYQPEEENLEQCGGMFFNGRLVNIDCDMRSFFVCEREVKKVITPDDTAQPLIIPFVGGGVDT
ncbi:hypothetical protein PYW08_003921 [Mythimna loreyi]|uniref:Uncharacterized protein n=1 Tax=Mythimna loreyi TaxID=667449 RepID=A0ACC2QV10_9NEOP|nr:hypothetical protein PYW08_003921 [Mythimna loreyi]